MAVHAAILGPGNIGTDLLYKKMFKDDLEDILGAAPGVID